MFNVRYLTIIEEKVGEFNEQIPEIKDFTKTDEFKLVIYMINDGVSGKNLRSLCKGLLWSSFLSITWPFHFLIKT